MNRYGYEQQFTETITGLYGIKYYTPFLGVRNKGMFKKMLGYPDEHIETFYKGNVLFYEGAIGRV